MVWTCGCARRLRRLFSSGRGLRDLRPEAGTYQKKCPPHPRCHFFGLQSPLGEADPTPCRWDHPDRPTNGPSTSIWGRGRWRPTHLPAVKQTEVENAVLQARKGPKRALTRPFTSPDASLKSLQVTVPEGLHTAPLTSVHNMYYVSTYCVLQDVK